MFETVALCAMTAGFVGMCANWSNIQHLWKTEQVSHTETKERLAETEKRATNWETEYFKLQAQGNPFNQLSPAPAPGKDSPIGERVRHEDSGFTRLWDKTEDDEVEVWIRSKDGNVELAFGTSTGDWSWGSFNPDDAQHLCDEILKRSLSQVV